MATLAPFHPNGTLASVLVLTCVACDGGRWSLGLNLPDAPGRLDAGSERSSRGDVEDTPPDAAGASSMVNTDAASVEDAGSTLVWTPFGEVELVAELSSDFNQDDATLTSDGRTLFFGSRRDTGVGGEDIWFAQRQSVVEPFDVPMLAPNLNTSLRETAVAVAPNGLSIWFASDRGSPLGGLDVWQAIRTSLEVPFSEPEHRVDLSSEWDDLPRAPNAELDYLPVTVRTPDRGYDIHFSRRGSDGIWGPLEVATSLNTSANEADATLDGPARTVIFASDRDDPEGDLYFAQRLEGEGPFGEVSSLTELNTEFEESDPWLSGDGKLLYFTSTRGGVQEIYRASRP